MYVCANEKGDYLRRCGSLELTDPAMEKHPCETLRAVEVFEFADAAQSCLDHMEEPSEGGSRLELMPLFAFGSQVNEHWLRLPEEQRLSISADWFGRMSPPIRIRVPVYSDPDAFLGRC